MTRTLVRASGGKGLSPGSAGSRRQCANGGRGCQARADIYYWYGSKRNATCTGATCQDAGINLYSSKDLYAWSFVGTVVNATNVSATGNLDLERPR